LLLASMFFGLTGQAALGRRQDNAHLGRRALGPGPEIGTSVAGALT
jgi:hypothetical protein